MNLADCRFETERLVLAPWHRLADDELTRFVAEALTPEVTRPLPPPWQGPFDLGRARQWIADRDAESTVLLATTRGSGTPVGLLILFASEGPHIELRLGYLLAQPAWGRGLASELLAGLVAWCRTQPDIAALAGGVEAGNPASKRVLEKNGFVVSETMGDQEILRLELGRAGPGLSKPRAPVASTPRAPSRCARGTT